MCPFLYIIFYVFEKIILMECNVNIVHFHYAAKNIIKSQHYKIKKKEKIKINDISEKNLNKTRRDTPIKNKVGKIEQNVRIQNGTYKKMIKYKAYLTRHTTIQKE